MVKRLSDIPISGELFIDANVLIHIHGKPLPPQAKKAAKQAAYTNAIGPLLQNNRKLITTWLNVMETLNAHERHMFEEYRALLPAPCTLSKKQYRHLSQERKRVQAELRRVLNEIKNYYTIISADPSESFIEQFVSSFASHTYDPNDFLAVETIIDCGVMAAVTDDADFYGDSRLTVYTYS